VPEVWKAILSVNTSKSPPHVQYAVPHNQPSYFVPSRIIST
jgi:hypothetical protein